MEVPMGSLGTMLLTLALEVFKAAKDLKTAKKVEDILAGRPKLKSEETKMYLRAAERLGRPPR
jgi:hypothetical protein